MLHQPAIGVLAVTGRDALGDDRAARIGADVDHLGAGVGLLVVVGGGHRIELADRVLAAQHAARVFPGDRRAGLDLGPGNARIAAAAFAALGDEVVDAAAPLRVARVPVLHRRVLDLRVVQRHQLDHRGVQLVLVAHRRGAALEVAHVAAAVGDDQRALELPGVGGVDAEVRGQLHRAAHAGRHVDERAVGEHGAIERGVEIVGVRHDAAEVLLDQLRVRLHGFGERAEDHAGLGQPRLERGGHRDAVEHGVDRHAGQARALVQRHAELGVGLQQLRVDFLQALGRIRLGLGRRVIGDGVVIDGRVVQVRPVRFAHVAPVRGRRAGASRAGTAARACARRSAAPPIHRAPAGPCRTRCR